MRRSESILYACILAATLGVCAPPNVSRADSSSASVEEAPAAAVEFDAKRESLAALRNEIRSLKKRAADTEGIDREILDAEIERVRIQFVRALHGMAKIAVDERVGEELRAEARNAVAELLTGTAVPILAYADDLKREISRVAEERTKAAAADVLALEQKFDALVAKQDATYALIAQHAELLHELGISAAEEMEKQLVERLQARAQLTAGRIHLAMAQRDQLEARAKLEPDNADVKARLTAETERIKASVASLDSTVDLMEDHDLDDTRYRQLLLQSTGEFSTDIFDKDVAAGLVAGWWEQIREWVDDNGVNVIVKILIFTIIISVFRILSGVAVRLVKSGLSSSKVDVSSLLAAMLEGLAGSLVMIAGLLVALSQLGVSVGPLVAGLGIAGFIVGFALQDTLSNFASGMMILLYRPFDVGDAIEAASVTGKVERMNLVSTTILTFDNQTLIVPNSKIWGDVIRNITAQKKRRVDLTFGIGYADDVDHAEKVLKDLVSAHDLVLSDPEPVVEVHALGDSSVDFVVRPWVKTGDYWRVYWDLTKQVKQRFDAEGISIPFPQRDLHVFADEAIAFSQHMPGKPSETANGEPPQNKESNGHSLAAKEIEPQGDPAS